MAEIHQALPQDLKAEMALITAAMQNTRSVLIEAGDLSPAAFWSKPCGAFWSLIQEVGMEHPQIDPPLVHALAGKREDGSHIIEALNKVYAPGVDHGLPFLAGQYAASIRECHKRRQMIELAYVLRSEAHNPEADPDLTQAQVLTALANVTGRTSSSSHVRSTVKDVATHLEDIIANDKLAMGIDTGFVDLTRKTGGFQAPDYWIIAARPSQGKTSLAMCMAMSVAMDAKKPVGVFSLEQSDKALVKRLVAAKAGVNMRNLRRLQSDGFTRITTALSNIANMPMYIDDHGGHNIATLRAEARRMRFKYHVEALFIDYIQIIKPLGRNTTRYEHLTELSGELKAMAKELEIPVVVLSQLSRNTAQERRRPRLDDLRESGALEQDADVVVLLSGNPALDELPDDIAGRIQSPMELESITVADVAKNREGDTGTVYLRFEKQYTRYTNLTFNEPEAVP